MLSEGMDTESTVMPRSLIRLQLGKGRDKDKKRHLSIDVGFLLSFREGFHLLDQLHA